MQLQFATQSYRLRSLPASAQRLVNLFAQQEPADAKSSVTVNRAAGLRTFATAGSGPIRGLHVMNDVLYAVSGSSVYSISSGGTATSLGTVAGTSAAVDMAENGNQLVIVTNPEAYVVSGGTVTQITDPDFPGAASVSYLDGYNIFSTPNSGQFFLSSLLDADDFDALDFATAESSPDHLVRVYVDHRELWLFGTHSTEVWINTGAGDFPFERQAGSILERGCAAALSVSKLDNTVFWLGEDRIVYRAQGYTPQRVSTHAIEQRLTEADADDLADARAVSWTQDGHAYYALTVPDTGTYVYDAATGLWHERQSYQREVWRAVGGCLAYGRWLVGDDRTGVLYELDPSYYAEGSDPLTCTADSPPVHADGQKVFMSRLQIDCETGVGLNTGQGSDPQMSLQWSDDGGRTWSPERWATMGAIGRYRTRVKWHRLGSFRERVLRVSISDPVPIAITSAHAELTMGML